ncbi:SGNH/GDSL hydrolase family protein [Pseudomonas sp. PCH199]|uniref:SGNH/GDSL hydrolase family protein n=1 Tax=unclassified Pseudomonas TaxID=196821 RepID=UPI000BCDFF0F|nr:MULTISPECIES: SGNH/GDSL hydrolase family protein [unclassified Pseudomonas]MCW8278855.1 SGNH/GDSL hydrolase family protein [Pseudomonas sp. PCH199]PAM80963.1 lipase [Pseudomonas sp. ERMR1:02]
MSKTETLAKIMLGPVLLMQGLYTRRVTPKLPEAEGEREGVTGNGETLRLLILGDSAAAGVGASKQTEALSGQLVSRLAKAYQVCWKLWAQSGLDSQTLLELLEQYAPETFDVALLSIGVNDVTGTLSAAQWIARQQQLMDMLIDKFGVKLIVISPLPPMHLFPALPQPLRWYLGNRAARFNARLALLADRTDRCTMLTTRLAPVAGAMARDGFHPGPAIYSVWADDAAQVIARHLGNTASGKL